LKVNLHHFSDKDKDKKLKRSHKTVGINVFLSIFADDRRIRIRTSNRQMDPDPDPGSLKTYGSGSATLLFNRQRAANRSLRFPSLNNFSWLPHKGD
jgi:hypothetical protein